MSPKLIYSYDIATEFLVKFSFENNFQIIIYYSVILMALKCCISYILKTNILYSFFYDKFWTNFNFHPFLILKFFDIDTKKFLQKQTLFVQSPQLSGFFDVAFNLRK